MSVPGGSRLLIRDLEQLVTPAGRDAPLRGRALADVDWLDDAYVLCEGGVIAAIGRMRDLPALNGDVVELDGSGHCAIPGLVDCHTHPSFAGDQWNDYVEQYVDYDLVGTEPELRSGVSIDAVKGDATDLFATSTLFDAIAALAKPAVLLRAEKGMMNDPTPLIGDALVQQYPQVKDLGFVAGTNHYTILLSDHGAKAIADAIRQAV